MAVKQDQESLVEAQFGPRAAAYVESPVHAAGEDLVYLAARLRGCKQARVLDLGCGGGHVGFTAAPEVASVVAYDVSPDMLAAVAAEARRRGFANIGYARGAAEALPFPAAEFDFVLCRFSAHHWTDVAAALREACRVLRPSGEAIFIDSVAPPRPVLDSFLQTIEMLRDPSHVRDYSAQQWQDMARAAGFAPRTTALHRLRLDFASWIARMATPEVRVEAIRSLQASVSDEVRAYFEIGPDGSFTIDVMRLDLGL